MRKVISLIVICSCVFITGCMHTSKSVSIEVEESPLLPFDKGTTASLRAVDKKVFAHYFSQFPRSINNKPVGKDYYSGGYMSPDGERGKHKKYGGFLRQRPLPRPVRKEKDWQVKDVEWEIKAAIEVGIDGFAFDILDVDGRHWKKFLRMLDCAQRVDPGFTIMLVPDMMAQLRRNPEKMVPAILSVKDHPSLYRLDDGSLVVSPYNAQVQTPEWWKEQIEALEKAGVKVAFVPMFQAWWKYKKDYNDISYGFADWGAGTADELPGRSKSPKQAHAMKKIWFAPVRPQDARPKASLGFEAHNTEIFRNMWQIAIDGKAEWVQLITWNDYSEASEIVPSTGTQYSFYDLTAYYVNYFKTGQEPDIKRDAIYYCYRTQHTDMKPDLTKQAKQFRIVGERAYNEVEMVAFLKEPGEISITLNGKTVTKKGEKGLNILRMPLEAGTPVFALSRNGEKVMQLTGEWEIVVSATYQNLLYHGGGGTVKRILENSKRYLGPKLNLQVAP